MEIQSFQGTLTIYVSDNIRADCLKNYLRNELQIQADIQIKKGIEKETMVVHNGGYSEEIIGEPQFLRHLRKFLNKPLIMTREY